ncbi:MAG: hypothetical protein H7247_01945 [Polaromonas sp.]|nr:hypothetical protein [Gemmatimonadaceae bacterium]
MPENPQQDAAAIPNNTTAGRAARFQRVTVPAVDALGDIARADKRLRNPVRARGGGIAPIATLDAEEGAGSVMAVVVRIEHGVVC